MSLALAVLLNLPGCTTPGAPTDSKAAETVPVAPDTTYLLELGDDPILNEIHTYSSDGGPDWIEILNPAEWELDLSDAVLWNLDRDLQAEWPFPDGTTIAPGGYLMVLCDEGESDADELHASFRLGREGGEVVLVYPRDSDLAVARVAYGDIPPDGGFARLPDGGPWFQLPTTSYGGANGALRAPTVSGTVSGTLGANGAPDLDAMRVNSCRYPERAVAEFDISDLDDREFVPLLVTMADDAYGDSTIGLYRGDGVLDADDLDAPLAEDWGTSRWDVAETGWGIWVETNAGHGRWLGVRVQTSSCYSEPLAIEGIALGLGS